MRSFFAKCLMALLSVMVIPALALAAGDDHPHFPHDLSLLWVMPFVGMLLSIAIFPLTKYVHFWHHNYGKVAAGWAVAFLVPCALAYGPGFALYYVVHTLLLEYFPFIILLLALFTVAGGIRLKGSLVGTPKLNTIILAIGTCIASLMGTTGAAMLLIRPLIRANEHRQARVHQIVFFIFLVANVGGSLSPLGDPPLFLGFLRGVEFTWTTVHLFAKTLMVSGILLAIFFFLDTRLYNKEGHQKPEKDYEGLGFDGGKENFPLLGCIVACVLFSGSVQLGEVNIYGTHVAIQSLIRDFALLGITFYSLKITPLTHTCRTENGFDWEPIREVAKLFIGIFLTMIPALAILGAGKEGALAGLVSMVETANGDPNNMMYFWITGTLSAFLDNAPTYVVFFTAAGNDAQYLMTEGATTLAAISAGAVFMGAVTYIGNAPNFMVKAIAENSGIQMPSFFGYMKWSVGILVPILLVMTFIFF